MMVQLAVFSSRAKFCTETEISSYQFSVDSEFLLVSCHNKKGLLQLCIHDAQQQAKMATKNPGTSLEQARLNALTKDKVVMQIFSLSIIV